MLKLKKKKDTTPVGKYPRRDVTLGLANTSDWRYLTTHQD